MGWREVVQNVKLRNPAIPTEIEVLDHPRDEMALLRISLTAPDRETGRAVNIVHEVQLGAFPGEDHAIVRVFWAVEQAWEHEVREAFHYCGARTFEPHP